MVNHHVPAAQVSGIIDTCWKPLGVPTNELELGSRQVHNNYRRMIPWISRVQIGWELTESYWRCQGDPDLGCTLLGDGTEKKKMHMESMVTQLDNGKRLTFIPWPQGDKAGLPNEIYYCVHNNVLCFHNRAKHVHAFVRGS